MHFSNAFLLLFCFFSFFCSSHRAWPLNQTLQQLFQRCNTLLLVYRWCQLSKLQWWSVIGIRPPKKARTNLNLQICVLPCGACLFHSFSVCWNHFLKTHFLKKQKLFNYFFEKRRYNLHFQSHFIYIFSHILIPRTQTVCGWPAVFKSIDGFQQTIFQSTRNLQSFLVFKKHRPWIEEFCDLISPSSLSKSASATWSFSSRRSKSSAH